MPRRRLTVRYEYVVELVDVRGEILDTIHHDDAAEAAARWASEIANREPGVARVDFGVVRDTFHPADDDLLDRSYYYPLCAATSDLTLDGLPRDVRDALARHVAPVIAARAGWGLDGEPSTR